jgi:transcriptional regulator with XRE-family HTH domain
MYIHNFCLLSSLLIRRMIESDKDYLVLLGQNIAKRRKILMMTQADLAYKIGMEVPNLSVIENGKSNPQILTLLRITAALQCELSEVLPQMANPDQVFELKPKYIPRKHKGLED